MHIIIFNHHESPHTVLEEYAGGWALPPFEASQPSSAAQCALCHIFAIADGSAVEHAASVPCAESIRIRTTLGKVSHARSGGRLLPFSSVGCVGGRAVVCALIHRIGYV